MTLTVHGALHSPWGLEDSYRVEAGKKITVECSGYWDEDVEVTAYFHYDGTDTHLSRTFGQASDQFEWEPDITDSSRWSWTQLRCEARTQTDSFLLGTGDLLSSVSADVTIVFPPQPAEDLFVAVERLGSPVTATITVLANPEVERDSVVWDLAGNFLEKVTVSSQTRAHSLEVRRIGITETHITLTIHSMRESDLGSHSVTVSNDLGRETYKVRFFLPESAQVFIGRVSSEIVVGSRENLECRSQGGNPPPKLEAKIEVEGRKVRNLVQVWGEEGSRPGEKSETFVLEPRVGERSDGQTFAVCVAVQRAGGIEVFRDVEAKTQLRIVYPPQPQEEHSLSSTLGDTAVLTIQVEAFPLPEAVDVVWDAAATDPNYRLAVIFPSSSVTVVTLTVLKVREADFDLRQTLTVKNEHGEQQFYFRIVKPTPAWVWVCVALAVLAVIAIFVIILFVRPGFCRDRKSRRQREHSNTETGSPFLKEFVRS